MNEKEVQLEIAIVEMINPIVERVMDKYNTINSSEDYLRTQLSAALSEAFKLGDAHGWALRAEQEDVPREMTLTELAQRELDTMWHYKRENTLTDRGDPKDRVWVDDAYITPKKADEDYGLDDNIGNK